MGGNKGGNNAVFLREQPNFARKSSQLEVIGLIYYAVFTIENELLPLFSCPFYRFRTDFMRNCCPVVMIKIGHVELRWRKGWLSCI